MDGDRLTTRRALLAAAAGGAAATAALAVGAPVGKAANGDPLILGQSNSGTDCTFLTADLSMDTVLSVGNLAAGPATAIQGNSEAGTGVAGYTSTGTGIYGDAMGPGRGVRGGSGSGGTGVYAVNGDESGAPSDTSGTGVFGYAQESASSSPAAGVWGDSPDIGVYGSGSIGVYGDGSGAATGLRGYSDTGFGLDVNGKVRFRTRSGRIAVSAGKTSVTKSVSGVTRSSIVIAVLQTRESRTWVRAAVPAAGKFTVYFNRALPSSSVVGWLVLN